MNEQASSTHIGFSPPAPVFANYEQTKKNEEEEEKAKQKNKLSTQKTESWKKKRRRQSMAAISQLRRNIDTNVAAIAKLLSLLLQAQIAIDWRGKKNSVSVKTQPKMACLAWEPKKNGSEN